MLGQRANYWPTGAEVTVFGIERDEPRVGKVKYYWVCDKNGNRFIAYPMQLKFL